MMAWMSLASSASDFSPEQLLAATRGISTLLLVLLAVGSAVHCALGYLLYRWSLAAQGVLAGLIATTLLLAWAYPAASLPMYLGGWLASAAVLGVGAWLLWRIVLAVDLAVLAAATVGTLIHRLAGTGGWAVGLLVGLAVVVMAFLYSRQLVVAFTAAGGAFGLIFGLCCLLIGWNTADSFARLLPVMRAHPLTMALLSLAATALALAGAWAQWRLMQIGRRRVQALPDELETLSAEIATAA